MLVAAKEKVRIIEEERTKKLRGNEHEQTGDASAQVQKRAPTPTRTPQLLPAVAVATSHDQTRTQFPTATTSTATASIARASTAHLHQEEPVAVVETAAVNKDVNLNSSYHARTLAASASTPSSGAETAYFNRPVVPVAQASDMSKSIDISLNSSYHARMLSSLALSGNTSAMNALLMYHQDRYGRPQYRYPSGMTMTMGAPATMAVNTSPPEFKLKSPYAVAASFSMHPTSTTTLNAPTASDSRVHHNHSFPRLEFPSSSSSSGTISIAQEIERLKVLRDEGTLTEEEFQMAKKRVVMGL